MEWWQAVIWGAAGGVLVEGSELYAAIRRVGDYPWHRRGEPDLGPFVVSVLIRVGIGAVLAPAFSATGQVGTPLSAVLLGISAPLVIEKLSQTLPVPSVGEQGSSSAQVPSPESGGMPDPGKGAGASPASTLPTKHRARRKGGVADDAR
jgi:hypothetical protein